MRLFVTGTDTDVGKTRVTAALAAAYVARGERPTIVKAVQTGLAPGVPGDAHEAAELAGCAALELARFRLASDPWSAALAEGAAPLDAATLAARIERVDGRAIVEGAGGAAVPINGDETLTTVAARASCDGDRRRRLALGLYQSHAADAGLSRPLTAFPFAASCWSSAGARPIRASGRASNGASNAARRSWG